VVAVLDFWLFGIAALFSMHQVSVRIGTIRADTLSGTLISIATTAILFSALAALFSGMHFNSEFLMLMITAGLIHFFLARTVFYQCISRLGANVAATLATTRIFFAAVLGYFLLGESVGYKLAIAAILVFAGVFVLTFHVVSDGYGIALGLLTGFLTALASVFARKGMELFPGIGSAIAGTALGYLSSLLLFFVFYSLIMHRKLEFSRSFLPFVAGGIFVGFGHLLRYIALAYYPVCFVETFVSMYPLFTYSLSGVLIKNVEVFNMRFFVSAFLILLGAAILLSMPVKL